MLADQSVRLLKGKLRLRQVTRRMDNGHQTPILTSRTDLPAAQVAYRMFGRWRQETGSRRVRAREELFASFDSGEDCADISVEFPPSDAARARATSAGSSS